MLVLSNPNTVGGEVRTQATIIAPPQTASGSPSASGTIQGVITGTGTLSGASSFAPTGGTLSLVLASNISIPPPPPLMISPEGSLAGSMQFVNVTHPGNAPDVTGFGSVDYKYRIGTCEVTNYDYTAFLNSVASSDPYGLYDPRMATTAMGYTAIIRSGESGSYRYAVAATQSTWPITYVSWFSAARFANWMHNGGGVDADTESGSYTLNGVTSGNVQRSSAAAYWVPTENEWYKAAYYSPTLQGAAGGYWQYPTQSGDVTPQTAVYSTPERAALPNSAQYGSAPSAFGTVHQGGNVWEYLDANGVSQRWLRGGGATSGKEALAAHAFPFGYGYGFGTFGSQPPDQRQPDVGFRLAAKPVNTTPLGVSLSGTAIAEGNALGAVVGQFIASTIEPGETITYRLTTGYGSADNALFQIVGNELRAAVVFDHESQSDYAVRVLADAPGRLAAELTIPITIANAIEPVDAVSFVAQPSVREGRLLSRIGTLEGRPIEATASTTFMLLGGDVGPAAGLFAINGDGVYVVSEAFRPNTEYQLRVRATDGLGTSIDRDVAVSIAADPAVRVTRALDLGDIVAEGNSPGRGLSGFSLDRTVYGSGIGTNTSPGVTFDLRQIAAEYGSRPVHFAAQFGTTDVSGVRGTVEIRNDFGVLVRQDTRVFNFPSESSQRLDFDLPATARYLTLTAGAVGFIPNDHAVFGAATLSLGEPNTAPDAIRVSAEAVAENEPVNTTVAMLSTTDANQDDFFTYELVPGAGSDDNASFVIEGDRLRTAAVFDHEGKSGYSVRIRTTDASGLTTERAVTITVTNVNERPTGILLSKQTVAENSPLNTPVGVFSTLDPDAVDTFTYELVPGLGGDDNARFVIVGRRLRTVEGIDFERQASYSVRVRATDAGGRRVTQVFAVSVNDVEEAPAVTQLIVPQDGTYGIGAELLFTLVTTQAVSLAGAGVPEIPVEVGGRPAAIVYRGGSGTNRLTFGYTVRPRDAGGAGIRVAGPLRMPAGTVFQTAGGSRMPTELPAASAAGVRIDAVVPTVAGLAGPASGRYAVGDVLAFRVRFTEAVTVTGIPALPLVVGPRNRDARYVSGSGTSELVFHYMVQPGDLARSGIATGKSLALPAGAVIRDAAGNLASLTLRQQRLKTVRVGLA
jgi:hypothetical protein